MNVLDGESASPTAKSIHLTVHVSRLKPYVRGRSSHRPCEVPDDLSLDLDDPEVMRQAADPLPVLHESAEIVNGDTLYEVDDILDRREAPAVDSARRCVQYLVRYKEHPVVPDKWVYKSGLAHCARLVGRFERNRRREGGQPCSQLRRVHSPQVDGVVPEGDC